MAGKTTGFHYSRQLQGQNPQNQNKLFFFLFFFLCCFSDCLVNRCEAVAKQSRGFTALDRSNTAGKTRGFSLISTTPKPKSAEPKQTSRLLLLLLRLFLSFFSACLVNRWETVGKQSCGFPTLNDQRRQEKQEEDFILLDNSKAKTCRDKTSFQKKTGKKTGEKPEIKDLECTPT
jgi:hypothetical protein